MIGADLEQERLQATIWDTFLSIFLQNCLKEGHADFTDSDLPVTGEVQGKAG